MRSQFKGSHQSGFVHSLPLAEFEIDWITSSITEKCTVLSIFTELPKVETDKGVKPKDSTFMQLPQKKAMVIDAIVVAHEMASINELNHVTLSSPLHYNTRKQG